MSQGMHAGLLEASVQGTRASSLFTCPRRPFRLAQHHVSRIRLSSHQPLAARLGLIDRHCGCKRSRRLQRAPATAALENEGLGNEETNAAPESSRDISEEPGPEYRQRILVETDRQGRVEGVQDISLRTEAEVEAEKFATDPKYGKPRVVKKFVPVPNVADDWLYEPEYGMPVVRRKISYSEFLRGVRQGEIRELAFFDSNFHKDDLYSMDNIEVEGYGLAVYYSGRVAQVYLPPNDVRANLAMETHGVKQTRLLGPPGPGGILSKPISIGPLQGKFLALLPIGFLIGVYAATQLAAWLKGDRADREAIRRYEIKQEREKRLQAEADERAQMPVNMAREGADVETICKLLDQSRTPYSRAFIEELVAEVQGKAQDAAELDAGSDVAVSAEAQDREQAMLARLERERQGDQSEMDRAKELLKMKTVKIQQAKTPEDREQREMRIKLRKAQSEMKGVTLQYTDEGRITFDDVAGIGESKVELTEVVDFFIKPAKFRASGARVPKGILMCGPPGTGKTLMARAVAGEAGVAFLSLNASEFVEMFAGLGASRVRDLFSQARGIAPAIIFIDEIDAVGRQRGGAQGNDERDQTLNQLLTEMDGFGEETSVIVMAATNRLDVLDSALVRPGRFDRIIEVGLPDFDGRIEVLKVHVNYRAHSEDIDYKQLSFETQAYSGAQLAGLVNDAAICASRKGRQAISMQDFNEALQEERLGPRKKGTYSQEMQRRIAVQEGATALVCCLMPAIEPLVLVTTVPRERFPLGQTVVRVNEQRERNNLFTRRYLDEQLRTILAGRAAEELLYGKDEMSTINQRRLVTARRIAAKLVISGAMIDNPDTYGQTLSKPYEAGDGGLVQVVPEQVGSPTAYQSDLIMEQLLNTTYEEVKEMLRRNSKALDVIIDRLCTTDPSGSPNESLSGSTLTGDEVKALVAQHADKSDLARRDAEHAVFM